jgi:hypothetical protein
MDRSQPVGALATPQAVAADILSRSAFLVYIAFGYFVYLGILATSPRLWFPFAHVAVTAYQLRRVWAKRPFDFWRDIRVRLSLMVFAAASLGPLLLWLYFFFFRPRISGARGVILSLAIMSLLCLVYGGLLLVSPRLARKFDYTGPQNWKVLVSPTPSENLQMRFAGAFLLLVGSFVLYVAVKLLQESLPR